MQKEKSKIVRLGKSIVKNWELYVLLLPAVVVTLLFKYYPMYGIQLAFKNLKLGQTIGEAEWVGFTHFQHFFSSGAFTRTVRNTLSLGVLSICTFPLPIILALLLHNCIQARVKKLAQTATYIPYLVSTAVTMSIVLLFCNGSTGFINIFLSSLGLDPVNFMGEEKYVYPLYIISGIWSSTGYSCVIYMAALSSVDEEMVDAAKIDGCSKLQKIWYIDIPTILPTIVILLVMNMGTFFSASTEKLLLLQTDLNINRAESIGTYTYKLGFVNRQFGYSAAVDLFTNLVNFIMLLISNSIAKRLSNSSLF